MRPRSDEAILSGYIRDGKLRTIPSKRSRKLIVFAWLTEKFELERRYSEMEVNDLLREAHEDYATLRRDLCDFGFMQRRDGEYWRTLDSGTSER
jgi:hypothetical protein